MLLSRVAVLVFVFNLSFFPQPLLALRLSSPNISPSAKPPSINISWAEESGDPLFIDIQIRCGSSTILNPPIHVKTSNHGTFLRGDPTWNGRTFTGMCYIQATDDSRLLGTSPSFLAPQLPTPPLSTPDTLAIRPTTRPTTRPVTTTRTTTTTRQIPPEITQLTSPVEVSTTSSSLATSVDAPRITSGESTTSTTATTAVNEGTQSPVSTTTSANPTGSSPFPTTSTTTGNEQGSPSHTSSKASVIGGVVGGLIFLALLLGLGFLYLRRIKARGSFATTLRHSTDDPEKAITRSILPSLFHSHHDTFDTIADPLIIREDYRQPEGKREQFLRVQQEMDEAQRQRELLRSDLNKSSSGSADNKGSQRDSEGGEIEERLRQQLKRMNSRILELEAQLTEVVEPPPDYTSSNHA